MATITCTRCNGHGGFDTIVPYLGIMGLCFECAGAGVVEDLGTIRCAHCHAKHETVAEVRRCATGAEAYEASCGGCGDEVTETWKHERCHLIDA